MARVGQLIRTFLQPTETFIHALLKRIPDHECPVFTRHRQHNDRFPHAEVHSFDNMPRDNQAICDVSYRFLRTMLPPERAWFTKTVREADCQLLHGHFGPDTRYFLPVIRETGLPFIVSFHGYDASSFPKKFFGLGARYLRPVLSEARRILCVSEHQARNLTAIGADPERIQVHHVGIDISRFAAPERPRLGDGEPVIALMVGRFVPKKGHLYLLRSLELIRELRSSGTMSRPLEVRLIGDGPLLELARSSARSLGLGDMVRFLGYQSHEEVARQMHQAHIYLQPSITPANGDEEGIPTTLMEAMATGLPVVASRHAGIPELVRHDETGLLVDEGDSLGFATALADLAANPDRWPSMGEAGRDHVHREFNADIQGERIAALYTELIT